MESAGRRNTLAIKHRLLEVVADNEYWDILVAYLQGKCSKSEYDIAIRKCIATPEAEYLHNELIRSIIFNAHFAKKPPPNVELPMKSNEFA